MYLCLGKIVFAFWHKHTKFGTLVYHHETTWSVHSWPPMYIRSCIDDCYESQILQRLGCADRVIHWPPDPSSSEPGGQPRTSIQNWTLVFSSSELQQEASSQSHNVQCGSISWELYTGLLFIWKITTRSVGKIEQNCAQNFTSTCVYTVTAQICMLLISCIVIHQCVLLWPVMCTFYHLIVQITSYCRVRFLYI